MLNGQRGWIIIIYTSGSQLRVVTQIRVAEVFLVGRRSMFHFVLNIQLQKKRLTKNML